MTTKNKNKNKRIAKKLTAMAKKLVAAQPDLKPKKPITLEKLEKLFKRLVVPPSLFDDDSLDMDIEVMIMEIMKVVEVDEEYLQEFQDKYKIGRNIFKYCMSRDNSLKEILLKDFMKNMAPKIIEILNKK